MNRGAYAAKLRATSRLVLKLLSAGYTPKELATQLGYDERTIRGWASGENLPRCVEDIETLARELEPKERK